MKTTLSAKLGSWSQQFVRLLRFALVAPEAREVQLRRGGRHDEMQLHVNYELPKPSQWLVSPRRSRRTYRSKSQSGECITLFSQLFA